MRNNDGEKLDVQVGKLLQQRNEKFIYFLLVSSQSFMASWMACRKAPFFPPNLLTTSSLNLCSSSSSSLTFSIPMFTPYYNSTTQHLSIWLNQMLYCGNVAL